MICDKPDAYSYENFIYGFRLGVGLMIEALKILDEFGRTVLPDISLSNGFVLLDRCFLWMYSNTVIFMDT